MDIILFPGSVIYHRFGKTNITDANADGFYCGNITFPVAFQGKGNLRVFPSTSFESIQQNGTEASVVIVDEINDDFFSVCVMEPAQVTRMMTINWFAFSDRHLPSGTQTGTASVGVFTSGCSCINVTFPQVTYFGVFAQPKVVNLTGLLQLVKNLLQTCQFDQVVYNKSVKIRLVATCRLQICYNLLKQLAACLWIISFDNQLATSLLTTCNRLVVKKLSQAVHSDIGLLMTSLLQRCQQTCPNLRVFLLPQIEG